MKKMRLVSLILVLFAVLFISVLSAHAALKLRGTDNLGNRLIYDTDLNITWYDYSRDYDYWQNQVDWAADLDILFGGSHYTDWRLPTTVNGPYVFGYNGTTTAGYNITSSEMGHLFYTELSNTGAYDLYGNPTGCGYSSPPPRCLTNTGPFENLNDASYWSGTENNGAWYFRFYEGNQTTAATDRTLVALAVRDGDVAPIISIDIDIKPGSYSNRINLKSKGVIPVAILTSDDFDATTVDPSTVVFGPNQTVEAHGKGHIIDVDEDGDLDLVLHFRTQQTGIACGDTEAGLKGETFDGQVIEGVDSISIVKCKKA